MLNMTERSEIEDFEVRSRAAMQSSLASPRYAETTSFHGGWKRVRRDEASPRGSLGVHPDSSLRACRRLSKKRQTRFVSTRSTFTDAIHRTDGRRFPP